MEHIDTLPGQVCLETLFAYPTIDDGNEINKQARVLQLNLGCNIRNFITCSEYGIILSSLPLQMS